MHYDDYAVIGGLTLGVTLDRLSFGARVCWQWTIAAGDGTVIDTGHNLSTPIGTGPTHALGVLLSFAAAAADTGSGWDGDAFNAAALEALRAIADDLELAQVEVSP